MAAAKELPEVVGREAELEQLLTTLERARDGTGATVRLGTAVRQYRIEFLLRDGSSSAELDEAADLIDIQLRESEASGFKNMLTTAHSLAAELALRRGDTEAAVRSSTLAVGLLEAARDLPIVRAEEILWRHGRSLGAAGDARADGYLDKARAVVDRKLESVGEDPAARERLLSATAAVRSLYRDYPQTQGG